MLVVSPYSRYVARVIDDFLLGLVIVKSFRSNSRLAAVLARSLGVAAWQVTDVHFLTTGTRRRV